VIQQAQEEREEGEDRRKEKESLLVKEKRSNRPKVREAEERGHRGGGAQ